MNKYDFIIMAMTISHIYLTWLVFRVDVAFIKLFKEKYGRLPTEWKDYKWK